MKWYLKPRTFFIAAAVALIAPTVYWFSIFYQTADLLTQLGPVNETFLDKVNVAFGLFVQQFPKAPISYLAPVIISAVFTVIGLRRRATLKSL